MKKKNLLIIALVICLFILLTFIAVYFFKPNLNIVETNNEKSITLEENITEYVYSEIDKENFIKTINENRDNQIAEVELKPNENYYFIKALIKDGDEETLNTYRKEASSEMSNFNIYVSVDRDILKPKLDALKMNLYDVFNEDLSLKYPEIFTGYIYNTGYYKNLVQWEKDHYKDFVVENPSNFMFRIWVSWIERLDQESMNDNKYYEKINDLFYEKMQRAFDIYDIDSKKYNIEDIYGYSSYKLKSFNNLPVKQLTINRLHQFFYMEPLNTTEDIGSKIFDSSTKKDESNKCFLNDYNLLKDNDYIINYFPEKIQKIDENTVNIILKIDSPIYSTKQINEIKNNIKLYFYNNYILGNIEKDFDIIVTLQYENLTNGMLRESDSFSIFAEGYKDLSSKKSNALMDEYYTYYNVFDKTSFNEIPWYPNEEAQKWIKSYFDKIKPLYDNDEHFSMLSTINEVSNECNADFQTVKNVILSYYWLILMSY